ncbi:MAG: ATP-binding protein [Peptococcaceae bacterium]
MTEKKYVLYGIKKFEKVIEEINERFKDYQDLSSIVLILSEAVSNAFKHGNKCDCAKPIYIQLKLKGNLLSMEVEDSGPGLKNVIIPENIAEEDILNEHGRGLFLIRCFADKIEINKNRIIIKKFIH